MSDTKPTPLVSDERIMNDKMKTVREALEATLNKCKWYASNDARIAQEVDHALCVEVPSEIEDAPRHQAPLAQ